VIASFDDGGTPAVLDLRLNFDEDIRIEQPGGVAVAEGDDLIARFAATNWLAGVDLAACAATLTPVGGRYVDRRSQRRRLRRYRGPGQERDEGERRPGRLGRRLRRRLSARRPRGKGRRSTARRSATHHGGLAVHCQRLPGGP
jgi:hypothetical protein